MARNPYTRPKRKTNRDIYNEELRKLEKLLEKAEKSGITTEYKPTKAKKITEKHIKEIRATNRALRTGKLLTNKQTKKRTKKAQTNIQRPSKSSKKKAQRKPSTKQKQQEPQQPYNEADRLPDTDILPFGVLAEQRFMHYLHELDHAISLLKMSRRYDETALMEFRDLLTDWYQDDQAEITQKLLESLESDGISDYNYFYNLVETGQIATVIYKAQAEHERFKDIYISEKFGILEDED